MRQKDTRRHLCFTPKLQTLSPLQHLLAYGYDYHNLPTSSNLFSFLKCSMSPGVELNACASIDIMSPLSPCTNRVSNTLTVCATRTQSSKWQDKSMASAPAYSSTPPHEHLCACFKHSIYYSLHLINEIVALHLPLVRFWFDQIHLILQGGFKQPIHTSFILQTTIKIHGITHLWNTVWKTLSHLLSGNLTSSEQVLTLSWLICKAIQAMKYICTLSIFQILCFCFHFQNVFIYTLIFDLWIFQVYMEPAVLNSGYTERSCKTSGDIIGYFWGESS